MIAERDVICVRPNGERVPVTLRIGKRYRASDVDWACPVEAVGLFDRLADMHGIDSFQALMLAQGLLRSLMQGRIEEGCSFSRTENDDPVSLEELFGKGI